MPVFSPPHLLDSSRWDNMRIGLLGGSFNPPHEGHVHISLAAMHALRLDCVWWLVTPQNPLKGDIRPMKLAERMELSKQIADHPRIVISDLEKDLGTAITYYSIRALRKRLPKTQLVWITGMDNALSLHEWHHWQALLREICMVHLTRRPARTLIKNCPLRMYSKQKHVVIDKGGRLPLDSGITYWLLQKKMVDVSSSELRENKLKQ